MYDTDGPFVADFIERFCKLSKGEWANDYIRLRPWQRDILNELFRLRSDGQRQHRTALIGLPRKNGKSSVGAALAIYGLIADGEPGAEVYSCAGDRQQARIVFGEAKKMVEAEPELSSLCKIYRDAIEVPSSGSVYRVLSADASLQQGLNPSFVLFDELHVQPTPDLWDAMTLGSGTRRQPLVIAITTAGFDRDSICYKLYDYGKRVASGEVDDPTFYFRWYEPADPDCDHTDPAVWQETNPAYGDFLHAEDFDSAVKRTGENAFRRYRLNQWTSTYDAWLRFGAWDACIAERILQPGERIIVAFDGSWTNDSTALVAVTLEGGFHVAVLDAWEKPAGAEEWRVPVADVEEAIRQACRTYEVAEVVCDAAFWKRSLEILADEGLPLVEWPSTVPRMVGATKKFEDGVYEQRLTHDGDPRLARHIGNCVTKADRRTGGQYITKEFRGSPRKIDLAVASLMAFDRATAHVEPPSRELVFLSM